MSKSNCVQTKTIYNFESLGAMTLQRTKCISYPRKKILRSIYMKIVIKLFLPTEQIMHFFKDKNLHCNNSKKKKKKRFGSSSRKKSIQVTTENVDDYRVIIGNPVWKSSHTEKFMIVKAKRVEPTQRLVMFIGINKINDSNSGCCFFFGWRHIYWLALFARFITHNLFGSSNCNDHAHILRLNERRRKKIQNNSFR